MWYMPIGVKHQVSHFPTENRGSAIPFTYNHPHGHHWLIFFNNIQLEIRHVDQNVALPECLRQPAPTFQIQFELTYALLNWNIQCFQCGGSNNAIDVKSMPLLESAQGLFKDIIKMISNGILFIEIACNYEAK